MARMPFVAAFAWLALTAGPAGAATDPAIKKATESVAWLKNFACAVPGQPMSVAGLESASQTQAMRTSNWEFSEQTRARIATAMGQREQFLQIAASRELKAKDRESLERLQTDIGGAVARISTALVNWSLANFVDISRSGASFDYRSSSPHPLGTFIQSGEQLRQYVANFHDVPEKAELLVPIQQKFQACLIAAQNQVIDASAASIRAGKSQATTSADIDRIFASYRLINDTGPQSAVFGELTAARKEIEEMERLAEAERDKLRQQRLAQEQAERQRLAEINAAAERERNAKKIAQAQANLPVAKKLVMTLSSGYFNEAAEMMDSDVSLSVPNVGPTYGKSAVLDLMRKALGSGSGSIDVPEVTSSGDIVSSGQGSRGRFQLYIRVDSGLVTQMSIVR